MHIWFSFSIRLFTNLRGHNLLGDLSKSYQADTWALGGAAGAGVQNSCKASGLGGRLVDSVYNYEGTSMQIDITPCKMQTCL